MSGGSYRYNRFDDYENLQEKKKQGFNDELDDALGEKDGKESDKEQSKKDRRDESEGEEESKGKGKYSGDKEKDEDEDKKKKDVKEANMNAYVRALSKMGNVYVPEGTVNEAAKADGGKGKESSLDKARKKMEGEYKAADAKEKIGVGDDRYKEITNKESDKFPAHAVGLKVDRHINQRKDLNNLMKQKSKGHPKIEEGMAAEDVVANFLIAEGYTNNSVSAGVLIEHMSDEWFNTIVEEVVLNAE